MRTAYDGTETDNRIFKNGDCKSVLLVVADPGKGFTKALRSLFLIGRERREMIWFDNEILTWMGE